MQWGGPELSSNLCCPPGHAPRWVAAEAFERAGGRCRQRMPSPRGRSASEERERGDKASRRAAEREAHRARERAERAAREQRRLGIEDMQARARPPAAVPQSGHVLPAHGLDMPVPRLRM
jgi:hypothetical protein